MYIANQGGAWFYIMRMVNKDSEWRGPFVSREVFEEFQDESIAKLVQFAINGPEFTNIPECLEDQIWKMGKYLPAAILGLGRHNPNATQLYVFENTLIRAPKLYGITYLSSGPTILKGKPAYERMVNAWHNVDTLAHQHRFSVEPKLETPYDMEIVHSGKECLLIGRWILEVTREQYFMDTVTIPDTSRDADMHTVDWTNVYANGGAAAARSDLRYATVPFEERDSNRSKLSEEAVVALTGELARSALQKYGKIGLYQHLLWSGVQRLLSGVNIPRPL